MPIEDDEKKVISLSERWHTSASMADPSSEPIIEAVREAARTAVEDFEESDQEVIRDEEAFYTRFRIDLPLRGRKQLLAFKHIYELTDRQIRRLHALGHIRVRPQGVRWTISRWDAWYGRFIITLIAAMTVLASLIFISQAAHYSLLQALRGIGAVTAYLGVIWAVDRVYLQPWRIWRSVRDFAREA